MLYGIPVESVAELTSVAEESVVDELVESTTGVSTVAVTLFEGVTIVVVEFCTAAVLFDWYEYSQIVVVEF